MATRGKYQSLTLKRKLEILDEVEKTPAKKKKDTASQFGIPPSTLSTLLKDKDKIRSSQVAGRSKRKRNRDASRQDVDAALFQWFTAVREQSVPISGETLKVKAEEFSKELGEPDWACSSGWLSRWKDRHNIAYRSVSGESASVNTAICDDWKERTLKPVLRRYDPNDVFNADETGLFWRLLPDKTHAFRGELCTGVRRSKERVTVLVCANMTGTEKCPLLTIGKYKRPRCFRGVALLPTDYEANPNAWMSSQIFEAWLQKWNSRLARSGRKVALFLDNCTAHPNLTNLDHIELVFLPPNTTSKIQPCDQGIIKTLKTYYRKSMVERLLQAINSGLTVADFKITLLDGLQMLRKAWESGTPETIKNCFGKAGFREVSPGDAEEDDDPFRDIEETSHNLGDLEELALDEPCTFNDYLTVDENLQCAPLPNTEDIVASIGESSTQTNESDDDMGEPLPIVSYQQAHSAFLTIQSYLMCSSDSGEHYNLLGKLENEIKKCDSNRRVQSQITDFFPTS